MCAWFDGRPDGMPLPLTELRGGKLVCTADADGAAHEADLEEAMARDKALQTPENAGEEEAELRCGAVVNELTVRFGPCEPGMRVSAPSLQDAALRRLHRSGEATGVADPSVVARSAVAVWRMRACLESKRPLAAAAAVLRMMMMRIDIELVYLESIWWFFKQAACSGIFM